MRKRKGPKPPTNSTSQKIWDKYLESVGLGVHAGENHRVERLVGDDIDHIFKAGFGCGGGRRVRPRGHGPDD